MVGILSTELRLRNICFFDLSLLDLQSVFKNITYKNMYAIVNIGGKQYKAEKDQFIYTNRLEGKEGSNIELDVLLIGGDDKIEVGTPLVKGAKVSAKILSHLKDDKVIVFHKKRRKGYQKSNGHRQYLTKVLI